MACGVRALYRYPPEGSIKTRNEPRDSSAGLGCQRAIRSQTRVLRGPAPGDWDAGSSGQSTL